ncbi:hypothetical protein ACWDV4_06575 [Micromonospora sp. NPDC003197]
MNKASANNSTVNRSIDVNGDGVADMYPAGTRAYLNKVDNAGAEFEAARRAAYAVIDNTTIGRGPMGEKFMENYEPPAEEMRMFLVQVADAYQQVATGGHEAVQMYESADAEAAQGFPGN